MLTRFSKLRGFDNIIAGRDLNNLFKEGHVYSVTEIMSEFIITDLGEHATTSKSATFSSIMMDGTYLLTKEEDKKQNELKQQL